MSELTTGSRPKEHGNPSGKHELILTERGVKEQLTILERPAGLAGDFLVYETAVSAGAFPVGPLPAQVVEREGLRFPPGLAYDAEGRNFPLERWVANSDGGQRLYTGVALSLLEQVIFPLTIDPSINIGGHTADGQAWGQSSVYATARATSFGVDSAGSELLVGQIYDSSIPRYYVYRSFLKFDLSSIDANAEILSATLGLVCTTDLSTLADFDLQVVKQNWSGQDPLADANREAAYDNCLSDALDVAWRNTSGLSTGVQYFSPPLDASYLTPGGTAYFSLRSSRDKNNTPPSGSGNEYIRLASANHGTPAYRPVLVVDYATIFPVAAKLAIPAVTIAMPDTRIKLRARKRSTSLSTTVRSQNG